MIKKNIAGLSLKGGRRDKFYLCLLEYYENKKRWFLKALPQVADEDGIDGDEAIRKWIAQFELHDLVVDIPLSLPACARCSLMCPGDEHCPQTEVKTIRRMISENLERDRKFIQNHPKQYERDRNQADEVDFSRNILAKESTDHILSKSFKRKLNKGYIPYWNRALDYWVWCNYYDQLLGLFNISFDSYGNNSVMQLFRFSYLRHHFPKELSLWEANIYICLVEMLRSKMILKRDILLLNDIDQGAQARLEIVKSIEKRMDLFVYKHDLELLAINPLAFESFLLAIVGRNIQLKQIKKLPEWAQASRFVVPSQF